MSGTTRARCRPSRMISVTDAAKWRGPAYRTPPRDRVVSRQRYHLCPRRSECPTAHARLRSLLTEIHNMQTVCQAVGVVGKKLYHLLSDHPFQQLECHWQVWDGPIIFSICFIQSGLLYQRTDSQTCRANCRLESSWHDTWLQWAIERNGAKSSAHSFKIFSVKA